MNDLIPIDNNEVSLPREEVSLSSFSSHNNRFVIFIIPIAFLLLLKHKGTNSLPILSSTDYTKKTNPFKVSTPIINPLDPTVLDKMTHVLEGLKKANTLNDLRKSMASSGKLNMDVIKELFNVFGSTFGENSKSQIQNITNMMSMIEKAKDIKKVMDLQKVIKPAANGDPTEQINHMIEAIAPLLPEEQAKNIDSFKKMAQMMKLMSILDNNKDEDTDDDTIE